MDTATGSNFRCLETDRLLLRAFADSDLNNIYEYACDAQTARFMMWEPHQSPEVTKVFLDMVIEQRVKNESLHWAIVLKDNDKLIGSIDLEDYEPHHFSISAGYTLNRAYWNQGLMTEALKEVIDFAFSNLNIRRLEIRHVKENAASGKVMLKNGLQYEGTLRKKRFQRGCLVDLMYYSLLREEWVELNKAPSVDAHNAERN